MQLSLCSRLSLLPGLVLLLTAIASAAPSNQLTTEEQAAGWKLLFDGKTTQGWHAFRQQSMPGHTWVVEDEWLHCLGKSGDDILSEAEFDQFDLQWEWKMNPGGNSGVKYFVLETRNHVVGHEYQIVDDETEPDGKKPKHVTASFYDVLAPTVKTPMRPMGELNQSRILVQGNHVEHWLNGVKVLEYECGSEAVKAGVAQSKFKNTPDFGNRLKGHILLQAHGGSIWFRNVKIRDLSQNK
jgi:hypothetical protein